MNDRIKIRPKAYEDINKIYQYSLQEFGENKARQYIQTIDRAFHILVENNDIGIDYHQVQPELLGHIVASHIVFFKRSEFCITVIRILHQSMDFNRHL